MIIKGNNLIALYSLVDRYASKIKLIYLDPPFNTKNGDFPYNDRFNHSTWLTFMKNRIDVARKLLKEDGLIFIEIDHLEEAYLKVLLDMSFGIQNYVATISVKSNSISGSKTSHKGKTILKNYDSILVYKNGAENIKINPQYTPKEKWDTHYSFYLRKNSKNELEKASLKDLLIEKNILERGESIKANIWDNKEFQKFANENKDNIFREVNSIPDDLKEKSIENKDQIVFLNHKGKIMYALNGTRYSPLSSSYKNINGESVPAQLLGDLWTDIDYQNTQNQGGVSFTNAKKPEQLLKRIINLCTNEGDIVLDCFMGSATTQAVALKLNRQFIGVEQMDYINTISVPRLQKVIEGEQGGISKNKDVKWQGGGSFIYAELMEKSQGYLKDIKEATDVDELMTVYNRMKANSDINFRVDLDKFEKEFQSGELTTLDDLKKELILIIDKNQLYYNYSNIDDETVRSLISDSDYKFNKSFYATRGEWNKW